VGREEMNRKVLFYFRLFVIPIIPIIIGIAWINHAVVTIDDSQEHIVELVFGGAVGVIFGNVLVHLSKHFDLAGKKWGSWQFWLWLIIAVLSCDFIGGFPGSKSWFIQRKDTTLWSPFRVSFTASLLINFGLTMAIFFAVRICKSNT
jgi:hypothetical protein